MSTYILMKILESVPRRYNRGIRLLLRGKLDNTYNRLALRMKEGDRVLDIGCGIGALSLKAAKRGAHVKGIDINPGMLEIARIQAEKANLSQNIEFVERGVAELEKEDEAYFDVVMSGLCFSELTEDELNFTLREVERILKPGGILLVADEVRPKRIYKKLANGFLRFFLMVIVFLLTGSKTRAIKKLSEKIEESGLDIVSLRLNKMENFLEIEARKTIEGRK